MTGTIADELGQRYRDYIVAWNGRDFDGLAVFYTEPTMFISAQAVVPVADRAAMAALARTIFARLEADDYSHSEIGAITVRECDEGLALMDVADVARLRRDGSAIETIEPHYTCRRVDGVWRFVSVVSCRQGWRGG